ncbi:MAG TPA: rhodanese-like domain-containing protein [Cycloclasticus sp.]|jgi:rhodanese-related sulfurtransferase|nr:rhodanese-like domain-containing protein [Cycloclasticus sp.]HIL91869.1 rhodanese-like domain-containing protein [Cycloclasticus sp.]
MSNIKSISPIQAYGILENDSQALLIDTRTSIEHSFLGHPISSILVTIKNPPAWDVVADFVAQIEKHAASKSTPLVLMCRSGARSMAAAKLLEESGYTNLYNMDEGFEGDKDTDNHRGTLGGWRFHNLPWEQS